MCVLIYVCPSVPPGYMIFSSLYTISHTYLSRLTYQSLLLSIHLFASHTHTHTHTIFTLLPIHNIILSSSAYFFHHTPTPPSALFFSSTVDKHQGFGPNPLLLNIFVITFAIITDLRVCISVCGSMRVFCLYMVVSSKTPKNSQAGVVCHSESIKVKYEVMTWKISIINK